MRSVAAVLMLVLATSFAASPVHAQLISPGKLSAAHAELEGMRQCTQCHELGQRGASAQRCLSCHTVLRTRIARDRGYHATVKAKPCAQCHKDHLGKSSSPLRWDTAAFKHADTGYPLKGAHQQQQCRECHAPSYITAADVKSHRGGANFLKLTYLGLATGCASCHNSDSPHGQQFGSRACQDCHAETDWKRVDFDHDAARFALTGAHVKAECSACHTKTPAGDVRYRGLRFASCADCHRDPHRGQMAGTCARCHGTADWRRVERSAVAGSFDHARTPFPLRGAHSQVACARCHSAPRDERIHLTFAAGTERASFPRPVVRDCASCHADPHPRSYAAAGGKASCAACHGLSARWRPVSYAIAEHNRAGNFKLDGAHLATPCNACHKPDAQPARGCASCHAAQDPHRDAFGKQACSDCHDTGSFRNGRMDHGRVKHLACASCHEAKNPHRDQFTGRGCDQCHGTESYRVARFDHDKTRFALDAAHAKAACSACHRAESDARGASFTRYRPLRTACKDCHGASS